MAIQWTGVSGQQQHTYNAGAKAPGEFAAACNRTEAATTGAAHWFGQRYIKWPGDKENNPSMLANDQRADVKAAPASTPLASQSPASQPKAEAEPLPGPGIVV